MKNHLFKSIITFTFLLPLTVLAELPWQHDQHTRVLALGDSLTAGYGADPITNGYAYRLYQQGVFDTPVHTLFANAAVPGLTSSDVRNYQLPQVERFVPDVIFMTVGGNDIIALLEGTQDLPTTIAIYQENLTQILMGLCIRERAPYVYIANLYDIPQLGELAVQIVTAFNQVSEAVVSGVAAAGCKVKLVDINSAFAGRKGLLNITRHAAKPDEVHPTNAGHRVMAETFRQVINQ